MYILKPTAKVSPGVKMAPVTSQVQHTEHGKPQLV
jgi:hypothetical protein